MSFLISDSSKKYFLSILRRWAKKKEFREEWIVPKEKKILLALMGKSLFTHWSVIYLRGPAVRFTGLCTGMAL